MKRYFVDFSNENLDMGSAKRDVEKLGGEVVLELPTINSVSADLNNDQVSRLISLGYKVKYAGRKATLPYERQRREKP